MSIKNKLKRIYTFYSHQIEEVKSQINQKNYKECLDLILRYEIVLLHTNYYLANLNLIDLSEEGMVKAVRSKKISSEEMTFLQGEQGDWLINDTIFLCILKNINEEIVFHSQNILNVSNTKNTGDLILNFRDKSICLPLDEFYTPRKKHFLLK